MPGSQSRELAQLGAQSGWSVWLLLMRCARRYWRQHLWQVVLMLTGMALGVAVVFSVDIANQSAKRAFALSLDSITGRTTHQVTAGSGGLDETVYTRLRTEIGYRNSAPLVEGSVVINGSSGSETLQLLGVDLFAEPMFRNQLDNLQSNSGESVSGRDRLVLMQTGAVVLGSATAARLGVAPGDTLEVQAAGNSHQLTLVNLVNTEEQPAFDSMAMADIATAQTLLSMHGKLSRIDLVVDDQITLDQLRSQFQEIAPGLNLVEASRRNNALQQMTSAFHTNLLAMSLLALLVGAFLIYNTVTLSVLQRRAVFGQLRVVGVRRTELAASIIIESLLFASVGIAIGLLLGLVLGGVLLNLVTRTINDLYFVLDVRRLDFPVTTVLKAVALGIGATVLAVLAPAQEAAASPPVTLMQRSTLESSTMAVVPVLSVIGMLFGVCGVIVLMLSGGLFAAFVALFLIVIGYSLLIPKCLVLLVSMLEKIPALRRGGLGQYPLRSLTASLSRTSVAVAALVVAVSATCGVGVMIGSFRLSVADWLGQTLQADIYIRDGQSLSNALPSPLLPSIKKIDGVDGLRLARTLDIEAKGLPANLLALDFDGKIKKGLSFIGDNIDPDALWQQWSAPDSVFISEPLSWRHALKGGDSIPINTQQGSVEFNIAGVFTDYGAGKGLIVMPMATMHRHWSDRGLSSIGVVVVDGKAQTVTEQLRTVVNQSPGLMMRSNKDIRELSLTIFDRTFAITHVLRLLTVGVAFVGILSALMALSLERRSEFAVLRALGMTPSELRRILFSQTGLMGLIAGILALPLGVLMSAILVAVINVRSFGWTMQFTVPPSVLLESVVLALVAALLAGWYPAWRLSRMSPSQALHHQ